MNEEIDERTLEIQSLNRKITHYEYFLGRLAIEIFQEHIYDAKLLLRGVYITFPNGEPRASL